MKRYLLYSFILHILLLSVALFFIKEQKQKEPAPFYARIVTPQEMPEKKAASPLRPPAEKQRKEELFRMPKLPRDLPPPKDLYSVPSRPAPAPANPSARREQKPPAPQRPHGEEEIPLQDGDARRQPDEKSSAPPREAAKDAAPERSREATGAEPGIQENGNAGDTRKPPPARIRPRTAREKLFDPAIIGDLAQKEQEDIKPDNSITFDTKEFKYYGYMQRLKEKIEGAWHYPHEAAARGIYGDLYIRFTIKRDGKLGAVELVRTSGHKMLDDAAVKALRNAEPFWPLPESIEDDALTITGRFIYSLYGSYIR
ncbi:MAG: TonB family protein [Thermodesulfovibrionales bacterium]